MRPKIIIDPGSCHCGSAVMAGQFIDLAADLGVDAVKFQLFPEGMYPGNCALPYEWFPELVRHGLEAGVEVFASTFEKTGRDMVMDLCDSIKFAHGRHDGLEECVGKGKTVYASYSYLDIIPDGVDALWCIPEYPVLYRIAFTDIFHKFVGFSDHSLGTDQAAAAIVAGAKVIEKHVRLDDSKCLAWPDGRFAISPSQLDDLMRWVGGWERMGQ